MPVLSRKPFLYEVYDEVHDNSWLLKLERRSNEYLSCKTTDCVAANLIRSIFQKKEIGERLKIRFQLTT